jgi:hypothetical protein
MVVCEPELAKCCADQPLPATHDLPSGYCYVSSFNVRKTVVCNPSLLDSALNNLYCCLQPHLSSGYYDVSGFNVRKPRKCDHEPDQALLLHILIGVQKSHRNHFI